MWGRVRSSYCRMKTSFVFDFHFGSRSPCESKLIVVSEVAKNLIAGAFALCLGSMARTMLTVFKMRSRQRG